MPTLGFTQNNLQRFSYLLVLLFGAVLLQGCQSGPQSISVNGIKRTYITSTANLEKTSRLASVTSPATTSSVMQSPIDTVILLHDYNSSGASFFEIAKISASIAKRPIRVIAPDALGAVFNDGSGLSTETDDVAFLNALLEQYHNKEGKIVLLGIGTGASMAIRFAQETPHSLHAVGLVAGYMFNKTPADAKPPANSIILYGNTDPFAPLQAKQIALSETQVLSVPSIRKTVSDWSRWLNCSTSISGMVEGTLMQKSWIGCQQNSRFTEFTIRNFGHHWAMPSPVQQPDTALNGPYLYRLNTTELMLNTFLGKVE
jgi:poly(3-hydroxybutyrate) depolymerase|tara:strand:+ start:1678 stop:2622 length:945 start_codon:yes stop_codon:yes gene_type:complete